MHITFKCPNCGKSLKTSEEHAGKQISCPGCERAVSIPDAPSSPVPEPKSTVAAPQPPQPPRPSPVQPPPTPSAEWHYMDVDGQQQGPATLAKMKQLVQSGAIVKETQVWKEGMSEWQPLSTTELAKMVPLPPTPTQDSLPSGETCCPKCASSEVSANRKGYSLGSGLVGAHKVLLTCLHCGYQWKAGSTTPSSKNFYVVLFLSVQLGLFGVDRFYLGHVNRGLLKLLTFGMCGWWWVADVILLLTGQMTDSNDSLILPPWKKKSDE